VWGEDASNLFTIPLQKRVTLQILNHRGFRLFKDLKETYHKKRMPLNESFGIPP
jgi:hypothetical protein